MPEIKIVLSLDEKSSDLIMNLTSVLATAFAGAKKTGGRRTKAEINADKAKTKADEAAAAAAAKTDATVGAAENVIDIKTIRNAVGDILRDHSDAKPQLKKLLADLGAENLAKLDEAHFATFAEQLVKLASDLSTTTGDDDLLG